VRGFSQVVLKVSEESRRRALRLLHTLFLNVEARGHQVRLRKPSDPSGWNAHRCALEVVIDGEAIEMCLREHLNQRLHEKTEAEKRWSWLGRTHDLVASGNLVLELRIGWASDIRKRWRDRENERLEGYLGQVIWAVDEAARALVAYREWQAERARLAEEERKVAEEQTRERRRLEAEEQRRKEELKARERYRRGLERDLARAAHFWASSRRIRRFLDAVEETIPVSDRGEGFRNWLKWAHGYARSLDPLSAPHKLARVLEPDLAQLGLTPDTNGK
jgi:hypothetical protein